MEAVKSSSLSPFSAQPGVSSTPESHPAAGSASPPADRAAAPAVATEAEQLLKNLEFEMARQRARRQTKTSNRTSLRALSVLMLLVLLGAAFFALWQLQNMHDGRRPTGSPAHQPGRRALSPRFPEHSLNPRPHQRPASAAASGIYSQR